ncbi:hypothetical protein VTL71DRAFT_3200 [Oculimacula yallundae]|uniref:Uncharacterized protein n=1 Tax=Oculimacula yallundae TaxID=86028 RepID=A0ABR4C754_9HELO
MSATTLVCCKCSQRTNIVFGTPPGTVLCSTCNHGECNDCDFKSLVKTVEKKKSANVVKPKVQSRPAATGNVKKK